MSTGKRPGGLTALAIVNFVWGGISLLGNLAFFALLPLLGKVKEEAEKDGASEEDLAAIEMMESMGSGIFLALVVVAIVANVLMIVSGVGFLKMKRFLGRTLGNAYAFVSIAGSLMSIFLVPQAMPEEYQGAMMGGMTLMTLIAFIYPGLILFLLNTTFKEDLVN